MVCKFCGKAVPAGFDYCAECGSELQQAPPVLDCWSPAKTVRREGSGRGGFRVLNPRGRLNRLKFLFVYALNYIAAGIFFMAFREKELNSSLWFLLIICILCLLLSVPLVFAYIKRFHDLNKSGWHVLLLLIPIVSIFYLVVLLFFPSVGSGNNYGEVDGRGHYWQALMVYVLVPLLVFVSGYAFPKTDLVASVNLLLHRSSVISSASSHFYSDQYRLSIDFPKGWVDKDSKDFIKAVESPDMKNLIGVGVKTTDQPSFSEYSDRMFDREIAFLSQADWLAQQTGVDSGNITDIHASNRFIGGLRFIQIDFYQGVGSELAQVYFIFGIYDSQIIAIQTLTDVSADKATVDAINACVDSLRIGDEAS